VITDANLSTTVSIEISPGELIDKITILRIKSKRIRGESKLHNVRTELDILASVLETSVHRSARVNRLTGELQSVNECLWDIEDEIRLCEKNRDFGDRFIDLARQIYISNDERAHLKREINVALHSGILEEKEYVDYKSDRKICLFIRPASHNIGSGTQDPVAMVS